MIDTNTLFFLEMALFSGVAIGFALHQIITLSPKHQAKIKAKAQAKAASKDKKP
ncbi:MAG: hypothetical protein RL186_1025 [Pseudomonadota bacterium]|jgi:hypothetical protein